MCIRDRYLDFAIPAFRLTHSGVKPETQIHTHMCYSCLLYTSNLKRDAQPSGAANKVLGDNQYQHPNTNEEIKISLKSGIFIKAGKRVKIRCV